MVIRRRGLLGLAIMMLVVTASGCDMLQDSPPTVTPIFITATPPPLIDPVVATETPSPSPVVVATDVALIPTQGMFRTATPTVTPPITMTPTFTPTMTDTPVTPGVVLFAPVGGLGAGSAESGDCANLPQGVFGTIYESNPDFPAALGCPLAVSAANVGSAYQPFQNGLMFWVSSLGAQPQSAIYALFNNGTYQRFNDTFAEGVDPASSGAIPPEGFLEPVRGFGKVWRENASVRDTLGWATTGESGGSAQVLLFERGEMVSVAQAGQIYILITGAPGSWTARSG